MCKYHIESTPKHRRKIIYSQYRESVREILRRLCEYKWVEIIEIGTSDERSCSYAR